MTAPPSTNRPAAERAARTRAVAAACAVTALAAVAALAVRAAGRPGLAWPAFLATAACAALAWIAEQRRRMLVRARSSEREATATLHRREHELVAAYERLQLLTTAVGTLLYDADLVTGEVFRSAGLHAVLGFRPDEAEPTIAWWHVRVPPEDLARIERERTERALTGDDTLSQEYRVRHRDGHLVDVWDRARMLRDDTGRVVRIVGETFDVTERKRLELRLRDSERRFRQIADGAPLLIWQAAPDGSRLYYNRRYLEFCGRDPLLMQPEQRLLLVHPDDRVAVQERFRHGIASRTPFELEYRQLRRDGAYRVLHHRVAPVFEDGGRLQGWVCSATDVTDERLATARNAALYRLVASLAGATTATDVAERTLREALPAAGAGGGTVALTEPPGDRFTIAATAGAGDADAFEADTPHPIADAVRARAPVVRPVPPSAEDALAAPRGAVVALPLQLDGVVLGGIAFRFGDAHAVDVPELGFLAAIADHCAQALDRVIVHADAEASAARWRTLADATPALVWAVDVMGTPTFANAEWCAYTGATVAALRASGWRAYCHADDAARLEAQGLDTAMRRAPFEYEFRYRRADGAYRWFMARSVPLAGAGGGIERWMSVAFDIHDLRELQDGLRRADRLKDEFLATLAHELRNPLAPIRNAAGILDTPGLQGPELRWARDVIDRQVAALARLLDDLLDVSRITRGRLELRRWPLTLAHVIRQGVETSAPLIEECGHVLDIRLPEADVWLDADPVRLAQVVANLLNNAAKYTPRGGRIEVVATRRGGTVEIAVTDTGIGIDPAHLPHVFDIFAQAAPALERSQGGLGIGLSLVRGLVEAHGGHVEARSAGLGHGSTFTVRLPVGVAPLAAPEPVLRGAAGGAPARIVLADDHLDSAQTLAALLRHHGHEVHVARDGHGAVALVAEVRPEVVLLDIGMPGLNGYDAARRLRDAGCAARLIAITGWGQPEDRERARRAGFDRHLLKPVDLAALLDALRGADAGAGTPGG